MIRIRPARESEVVMAFLKAEIDYSDAQVIIQHTMRGLGFTKQELLDDSTLDSDYHNAVRAIVFDSYRAYLRRDGSADGLFVGFPKNVTWERVELEPHELCKLRYVNSIDWLPVSEGTRLPQRVADRITRGELPELKKKVKSIQESLDRGDQINELVAVKDGSGNLTLIEGAHRTTAYVALKWPRNVPAFIGTSPLMAKWKFY